jgi:hypothetical protein
MISTRRPTDALLRSARGRAAVRRWNDLRAAILTHDIGAAATQLVLSPPDRGR